MEQETQALETTDAGVESEQTFDAFISYSRDDIEFGRALEKALQKFRLPKGMLLERRRLRVFRDETDLVGTHYPDAITGFLKRSRKLILICSPSARGSDYVDDEIVKFAGSRGAQNIVPVLYRGRPNSEFEPDETDDRAFPAALEDLMQEPLATDYRGFDAAEDKPNQSHFRNAWYTLLANLFDVGREEIERRDFLRQRRERVTIVSVVIVVIASLATFAAIAWVQKLRADEQRNLALNGLAVNLAAKSAELKGTRPDMSALVAVEAVTVTDDAQRAPVPEARQALRDALSTLAGHRLSDMPTDVSTIGFHDDNGSAYAIGANEIHRWPIGPEQLITDTVVSWSSHGAGELSATTVVSTNGRWFAAISEDETIAMDVQAGDAAAVEAAGLNNDIASMKISNDGRWLVAHMVSGALRILDLENGDSWQTVVDQAAASSEATPTIQLYGFGPGASKLHVADSDDKLRFWSLSDRVVSRETVFEFDSRRDKLAVGEDSNLLVLVRNEKPLVVYAFGEEEIDKVDMGGGEVMARTVRFSPGYRWLVAIMESGDALLWSTADLEATPVSVAAKLSSVSATFAFSPDGLHFTVATVEGSIRMWDMERPDRRPDEFKSGHGRAERILFTPDSQRLVTNRGGVVSVIDIVNGKEKGTLTLRYPSRILDLSISDDSRWLLTKESDALRLTDLGDPFGGVQVLHGAVREPELDMELSRTAPGFDSLSRRSGTPYAGLPGAGAFSADGRWFATIGARGEVLLLDRSNPRAAPHRLEGIDTATVVAFDSSGKWLAAGGVSQDVLAWNTGQLESQPLILRRVDSEGVSSVAKLVFSPDGRWLAAGAAFGEVDVWDWRVAIDEPRSEDGESVVVAEAIPLAGHDGWVLSIDFAQDGELLVTAGERAAQVWIPTDFKAPVARFEIPLGYSQARLIPGRRAVVTGGTDGVARIWDVDNPDAAAIELRGHESSILNVAVGPQGRHLATASKDGQVALWQLDNPGSGPLRELAARGTNAVTFVSSRELVTSGLDGTRLWNLADLSEPPVLLPGSRSPSYWMGVSGNADALATVSRDGSARLWPLGAEQLIKIACAIADTNLEHGIWRNAYGNKPYQKTCEVPPVHPSVVAAGRELAEAGDVDKAIELLTLAVALDPGIGIDPRREATDIALQAMLKRGKRLARDRKIIAASVQFERARALQADAVADPLTYANKLAAAQVHLEDGRNLANSGRLEPAIAKFVTARGVDPEVDVDPVAEAVELVVPVLLERARDAARKGDIERAIELYKEVIELDPSRNIDPVTETSRHAASGHRSSAERLARKGNIDAAIEQFELALQLDPTLAIDPVSDARRLGAPVMARRAVSELKAGRVDEGLVQLRDAMQAKPEMEITAGCWSHLCWYGLLWNRAAAVKDACERAVSTEPDNLRARDSRGLMRVLLGNLPGSIADFEAYIASQQDDPRFENRVEQRRAWIADMKNGNNPITEKELARLREAEENTLWIGQCAK